MSECKELLARLEASQKACFDAGQHVAAMDIQSARAALSQPATDAQAETRCDRCILEQEHRDNNWIGLSASEKAAYDWPGDTDLHRQCRAAYVAGATDYAVQGKPDCGADIRQHIGWIKLYVEGMTVDNWRDMKLRAERQLEKLSDAVSVTSTSQNASDDTQARSDLLASEGLVLPSPEGKQ